MARSALCAARVVRNGERSKILASFHKKEVLAAAFHGPDAVPSLNHMVPGSAQECPAGQQAG